LPCCACNASDRLSHCLPVQFCLLHVVVWVRRCCAICPCPCPCIGSVDMQPEFSEQSFGNNITTTLRKPTATSLRTSLLAARCFKRYPRIAAAANAALHAQNDVHIHKCWSQSTSVACCHRAIRGGGSMPQAQQQRYNAAVAEGAIVHFLGLCLCFA